MQYSYDTGRSIDENRHNHILLVFWGFFLIQTCGVQKL